MNMSMRILAGARKISQFVTEYAEDAYSFACFNHYSPRVPAEIRLYYRIIITAHTVEKGLSLSSRRLLFGSDKLKELRQLLERYPKTGDPFPVAMAMGAVAEYIGVHKESGCEQATINDLEAFLDKIRRDWKISPRGGTKRITKTRADLAERSIENAEFLTSRFSCRAYSGESLEDEVVTRIVAIAAAAPSQCNRQSTRLHCYRERSVIKDLLDLQGGSRGFSENVPNLFVVAFELPGWGGPKQRNQGYIDASLFAMALMFACHSMGVSSCPLNLAISNKTERAIRQRGNIPRLQRLVMMVAFGYPDDEHGVCAHSERLRPAKLVRFHD
jgi:nitroreductase